MDSVFTFLVQWIGVILSVILGIVVIISSNGNGLTKAEKEIANDDVPGHYLVRHSMGSFWVGFLLMLASCGLCYLLGYLGVDSKNENGQVIALVVQIAISVVCSIIFLFLARTSIVERVLVNGNEIQVHQRFGKPETTSFDQIRTVKKNGGETAVSSDSLTLRPNGDRRFTVKKSMKNFNQFAKQVERDVPLPDLTKKRS